MVRNISIGKALAGYAPVQIIEGLAAFASVGVFSRLLDTTEYGRYSLALTTVLLLQGSLFVWLHAAVVRFTAPAHAQGRVPAMLATALGLLGLLVAIAAAAAGVALVVWPQHGGLVLATLAALTARSTQLVLLEYHRASGHVGRFAALEVTQLVTTLATGVGLGLCCGLGASAPLWGMALSNLLCLAVELPGLVAMLRGACPEKAEARSMAAYGLPMVLASFAFRSSTVSDRFLIAWFAGEAATGVYAVAFAAADRPIGMLFNWIGMSFQPAVLSAFERDGPVAAGRHVARVAEAMMVVVLPAGVGLALVAEPLLGLLAGPAFREQAYDLVPWLAAAALLRGSIAHYFPVIFAATRSNHLMARVYVKVALISVFANLIALPWLGLFGAVLAGLATTVAGLGLGTVIAGPLLPVPLPWGTMLRAGTGCAAMAGALLLLPVLGRPLPDLALRIGVGVLVYAAVVVGTDTLGCRRWLRSRYGSGRQSPPD